MRLEVTRLLRRQLRHRGGGDGAVGRAGRLREQRGRLAAQLRGGGAVGLVRGPLQHQPRPLGVAAGPLQPIGEPLGGGARVGVVLQRSPQLGVGPLPRAVVAGEQVRVGEPHPQLGALGARRGPRYPQREHLGQERRALRALGAGDRLEQGQRLGVARIDGERPVQRAGRLLEHAGPGIEVAGLAGVGGGGLGLAVLGGELGLPVQVLGCARELAAIARPGGGLDQELAGLGPVPALEGLLGGLAQRLHHQGRPRALGGAEGLDPPARHGRGALRQAKGRVARAPEQDVGQRGVADLAQGCLGRGRQRLGAPCGGAAEVGLGGEVACGPGAVGVEREAPHRGVQVRGAQGQHLIERDPGQLQLAGFLGQLGQLPRQHQRVLGRQPIQASLEQAAVHHQRLGRGAALVQDAGQEGAGVGEVVLAAGQGTPGAAEGRTGVAGAQGQRGGRAEGPGRVVPVGGAAGVALERLGRGERRQALSPEAHVLLGAQPVRRQRRVGGEVIPVGLLGPAQEREQPGAGEEVGSPLGGDEVGQLRQPLGHGGQIALGLGCGAGGLHGDGVARRERPGLLGGRARRPEIARGPGQPREPEQRSRPLAGAEQRHQPGQQRALRGGVARRPRPLHQRHPDAPRVLAAGPERQRSFERSLRAGQAVREGGQAGLGQPIRRARLAADPGALGPFQQRRGRLGLAAGGGGQGRAELEGRVVLRAAAGAGPQRLQGGGGLAQLGQQPGPLGVRGRRLVRRRAPVSGPAGQERGPTLAGDGVGDRRVGEGAQRAQRVGVEVEGLVQQPHRPGHVAGVRADAGALHPELCAVRAVRLREAPVQHRGHAGGIARPPVQRRQPLQGPVVARRQLAVGRQVPARRVVVPRGRGRAGGQLEQRGALLGGERLDRVQGGLGVGQRAAGIRLQPGGGTARPRGREGRVEADGRVERLGQRRGKRMSLPRSERGAWRGRRLGPPSKSERRGRRMSLARSERGAWGGRRLGPPSKIGPKRQPGPLAAAAEPGQGQQRRGCPARVAGGQAQLGQPRQGIGRRGGILHRARQRGRGLAQVSAGLEGGGRLEVASEACQQRSGLARAAAPVEDLRRLLQPAHADQELGAGRAVTGPRQGLVEELRGPGGARCLGSRSVLARGGHLAGRQRGAGGADLQRGSVPRPRRQQRAQGAQREPQVAGPLGQVGLGPQHGGIARRERGRLRQRGQGGGGRVARQEPGLFQAQRRRLGRLAGGGGELGGLGEERGQGRGVACLAEEAQLRPEPGRGRCRGAGRAGGMGRAREIAGALTGGREPVLQLRRLGRAGGHGQEPRERVALGQRVAAGGSQPRQARQRRAAERVVGQRRPEANAGGVGLTQQEQRLARLREQGGALRRRGQRREPIERRGQAVGPLQRAVKGGQPAQHGGILGLQHGRGLEVRRGAGGIAKPALGHLGQGQPGPGQEDGGAGRGRIEAGQHRRVVVGRLHPLPDVLRGPGGPGVGLGRRRQLDRGPVAQEGVLGVLERSLPQGAGLEGGGGGGARVVGGEVEIAQPVQGADGAERVAGGRAGAGQRRQRRRIVRGEPQRVIEVQARRGGVGLPEQLAQLGMGARLLRLVGIVGHDAPVGAQERLAVAGGGGQGPERPQRRHVVAPQRQRRLDRARRVLGRRRGQAEGALGGGQRGEDLAALGRGSGQLGPGAGRLLLLAPPQPYHGLGGQRGREARAAAEPLGGQVERLVVEPLLEQEEREEPLGGEGMDAGGRSGAEEELAGAGELPPRSQPPAWRRRSRPRRWRAGPGRRGRRSSRQGPGPRPRARRPPRTPPAPAGRRRRAGASIRGGRASGEAGPTPGRSCPQGRARPRAPARGGAGSRPQARGPRRTRAESGIRPAGRARLRSAGRP